MGGNKEGARKSVATKLAKYGPDYFSRIGHLGAIKSTPGGFGTDKIGADGLTGPERASKYGKQTHKKDLPENDEKD